MIYRVSAIASSVITVMPRSGVVPTMVSLTGLNHKNAFLEQFTGMKTANLPALIAVIAAAPMIYRDRPQEKIVRFEKSKRE